MKNIFFKSFVFLFSFVFDLFSFCQEAPIEFIYFNYVNKLPSNILTSNSALIFTNSTVTGHLQNDVSEEDYVKILHSHLKEFGINTVIYYIDNAIIPKTMKGVMQRADTLNKLGVKNILLFTIGTDIGNNSESGFLFSLQITKFNGKQSLYDCEQEAYKIYDYDGVEELMAKLNKSISKQKLVKEQTYISDTAKYIRSYDIINGKRFNSFPNIKKSKFLQYGYNEVMLPENKPKDMNTRILYDFYKSQNKEVSDKNADLKKLFNKYNLNCEIIGVQTDTRGYDENTYVILPLFTGYVEEKEVLRPTWTHTTYHNTNGVYTKTEEKFSVGVRHPSPLIYVYYYLKNVKTGDVYFVDYGDFMPDSSLEKFLNKLTTPTD